MYKTKGLWSTPSNKIQGSHLQSCGSDVMYDWTVTYKVLRDSTTPIVVVCTYQAH
jgi:hypothetical protein